LGVGEGGFDLSQQASEGAQREDGVLVIRLKTFGGKSTSWLMRIDLLLFDQFACVGEAGTDILQSQAIVFLETIAA